MQFDVSFDVAHSPNFGNLTGDEAIQISQVMNAAANIWSHYLTTANVTLKLSIIIDNSLFSGNVLAQGGPDGYAATGATFNGKTVYESAASAKLRTGNDPNGTDPDLSVYLTVSSIRNLLSFKTDDFGGVPTNRVDALSVFLHEIGHGLGFMDVASTASATYIFDTFVQNGKFTGPNAEAAANLTPTGIPLDSGLAHISETSAYGTDLMSPALDPGKNIHISAIDLAILQDIGLPVRVATAGNDDLYAVYGADLHLGGGDDVGHAVYGGSTIWGEDGNDTLYGFASTDYITGVVNDILHGGNGDDTLIGDSSDDQLYGDAGFDTAVYYGPASDYTVTQISQTHFQVRATGVQHLWEGTDQLYDVERIQWGDGTFTSLVPPSGQNIVNNDELSYTSGGTIYDNISGTGHVSFHGFNAYYIQGNFTHTGGTTIYEGAVVIGPSSNPGNALGSITGDIIAGVNTANSGINFNRTNDITFSGNISGLGYVDQMGGGVLTLTGTNTYGSYTVIEKGTLAIASASNIGVGDIKLYGLGTLRFNGSFTLAQNILLSGGEIYSNHNNVTLSGVIGNPLGVNTQAGAGGFTKTGPGKLTLTGNNTYGGPTVISGGGLQIGDGGTTGTLGSGTVINNSELAFNRSDDITVANAISGSGSLIHAGGGVLTLTGANTSTGSTTIGTGTIRLGTNGNIGTGALTINGGVFDMAGRNQTVATLSGSGATIITGGGYLTANSNSNSSFGGVISGTGGFNKGGAGTLTLTGVNTYTGGTQVNAGTLRLDTGSSLAANTIIQVSSGATLDLNSNSLTVSQLGGTGNILLGSATLSIINSADKFLTNTVSGTGGLVKGGNSTLYVLGNNTYSGGTTISSGTLMIGTGGLTGSITGDVVDNGQLTFNRSDATTFSGAISGTGSVAKTGTGSLLLTGNNTYTGGTTLAQGQLSVMSGSSIGSGDIQIYGFYTSVFFMGASMSLAQNIKLQTAIFYTETNANVTMSGVISSMAGTNPANGSGGFSKGGAGTLTLTGNNTYNGPTSVDQGTLLVDGSTTATNIWVQSGATLGGTGYVGNVFVNAGGKLAAGDAPGAVGNLHVNGSLTFQGGGALSEDISTSAADEILVSGNVSLGGALTLNFTGGSYSRQTYTILHTDGTLSGTFNTPVITGQAGLSAQLSYDAHNVYVTTDNAPTVTTANLSRRAGQAIAAANLFTASDADGDTITRYQLWDENTDPNSGYFVVNGVAQAGQTLIDVSAAQLSQVSFVTGTTASDAIQIRAFDGIAWSAVSGKWAPFTIAPAPNHAPVVTTANINASRNQTIAASSLFTVADADNDPITRYQFWDENADPGSGHFVLNGVDQAGQTLIDISASQLSQLSFVAGNTASDAIQIRAFDGTAWSAVSGKWAPFSVQVPPPPVNHAPVVTTSNVNASRNQTIAAADLFTVADADSDIITRYQFWDENADPNSGHFIVNGVAQAGQTLIDIPGTQLSQISFVAGSTASDAIQIRAFDGTTWSAVSGKWAPFSVTVPAPSANHAPVVTTSDITSTPGQTIAASNLFSVSDADSDTISLYEFWDENANPSSGHFVVNGVAQAGQTLLDIPGAQLSQVSFVTGSAGMSDAIQIRAFDGVSWSAVSGKWAPFHINS
ncbi:MAG: autotransporter-associated beta strand repeat-containing protein [Alphaproteobacteria bacterium]